MVPATDKHYTAAIIERRDFSEDLWLIRVDPGGPFQFKAGQYATLGVDHGEDTMEYARSIRCNPMPGNHKLYCLQGGSRSWEFGYREELERFAAEVPWFKYVATISRPWEDAAWKGETGRVDDLVRKYTEQWGLRPETTTGYLCGHPSMCENGQGILQRAGWQKGSMFERFTS